MFFEFALSLGAAHNLAFLIKKQGILSGTIPVRMPKICKFVGLGNLRYALQ